MTSGTHTLFPVDDPITRPVTIELWPNTRWDSLQAIAYRVCEPLDPHDPGTWGDIVREAVVPRLVPQQGTRRRRWIAESCVEERRDVEQPPHLRPALVRALALSGVVPGGLLIERIEDLGSPLDQAVILSYLRAHAGGPGMSERDPDSPQRENIPGTFTIGALPAHPSRRGYSARGNDHRLEQHLEQMHAKVLRWLEANGWPATFDERLDALTEACAHAHGPVTLAKRFTQADASPLVGSLEESAAVQYAHRLRARGATEQVVGVGLQAFGFFNDQQHRLFNVEHVARVMAQLP